VYLSGDSLQTIASRLEIPSGILAYLGYSLQTITRTTPSSCVSPVSLPRASIPSEPPSPLRIMRSGANLPLLRQGRAYNPFAQKTRCLCLWDFRTGADGHRMMWGLNFITTLYQLMQQKYRSTALHSFRPRVWECTHVRG